MRHHLPDHEIAPSDSARGLTARRSAQHGCEQINAAMKGRRCDPTPRVIGRFPNLPSTAHSELWARAGFVVHFEEPDMAAKRKSASPKHSARAGSTARKSTRRKAAPRKNGTRVTSANKTARRTGPKRW